MARFSWDLPKLPHQTTDLKTVDHYRLWGSVRLTYVICAFLTNLLQISLRNMLGVVILRMTKARPEDLLLHARESDMYNVTTTNCGITMMQDDGLTMGQSGDLAWTRHQELTFPGTFYYGYVIALPFAGHLADRFGGKMLYINSLTLQSLAFIALPMFAQYGYSIAVTILVLAGLFAGCGAPPLYQLFLIWAHPTERTSMLSFAFSGLIVGSICIYPFANYLSNFGWHMPFYVLGSITLAYGISCNWLIYNSVAEHPRLTAEERAYLQPTADGTEIKTLSIPWKSLLTSVPVYAFMLTHVFHNYSFLVISLVMPRFMREAMQFNLKEIGFLSTAPFLGSLFSKLICVLSCSYVERRLLHNFSYLRRILYSICSIISILLCSIIIIANCEQRILVLVMYVLLGATTDLGFSGGYWPTLLYFAPSFAGLLSGLSNCIAHISGFLAPHLIARLVHSGLKSEWNCVLLTLILFNALAMIVFGLFSSTTIQPWDPRSQQSTTQSSKPKISDSES